MAMASLPGMATFPGSPSHLASAFIAATRSATSVLAAAPPVHIFTTKFASTTLQSILTSTSASPSLTAAAFRPAAREPVPQLCILALFHAVGYVHREEG